MLNPSKIKKQKFEELWDKMSIYFQDESSFEISQKMWRIIVKPKEKARLKWYEKRHDGMSIWWLYGMRWEFIYRSKKTKCAKDFLWLLYILRHRDKRKRLIVVVDNARIHHAKIVKRYCSEHNIILVYLPPYSPEHNPIEQLRKHIKRMFQKTQRRCESIRNGVMVAVRKCKQYFTPILLPESILS
jgi:transposase